MLSSQYIMALIRISAGPFQTATVGSLIRIRLSARAFGLALVGVPVWT